jgi:hypothetical protein
MEGSCFCHCGECGQPLRSALALCVLDPLPGVEVPPVVVALRRRLQIAGVGRQTGSYPANAMKQMDFACNLEYIDSRFDDSPSLLTHNVVEIVVVVSREQVVAARLW